jgi:hypothetical protein
MTSCIFTDNLNCRGQFRRLRSVRDALDQIHASFGTVKELTILDGSDRILAFIPARTTSGELKVWDYRSNKFADPKILLRSGAIFASSVASDEMQEAFRREILDAEAAATAPLPLAA